MRWGEVSATVTTWRQHVSSTVIAGSTLFEGSSFNPQSMFVRPHLCQMFLFGTRSGGDPEVVVIVHVRVRVILVFSRRLRFVVGEEHQFPRSVWGVEVFGNILTDTFGVDPVFGHGEKCVSQPGEISLFG